MQMRETFDLLRKPKEKQRFAGTLQALAERHFPFAETLQASFLIFSTAKKQICDLIANVMACLFSNKIAKKLSSKTLKLEQFWRDSSAI